MKKVDVKLPLNMKSFNDVLFVNSKIKHRILEQINYMSITQAINMTAMNKFTQDEIESLVCNFEKEVWTMLVHHGLQGFDLVFQSFFPTQIKRAKGAGYIFHIPEYSYIDADNKTIDLTYKN